MKRLCFFLLLLLTACSANTETPSPETINANPAAPQILSPLSDSEFVESDLLLQWDWPVLEEGQFFVLRLWYEEENPQEVWTVEKSLNAQELIDSYSRDRGIYHWQVAIVNTNADGGFEAMGSEWSAIQNLKRVRRLSLEPLALTEMSQTARFIAEQNLDTARDLIDFTRNWMFENTLIAEELDIYKPDYSDAAQMMYDYSIGQGEMPQMYCDGISTTMLTVLRELGIESRIIYLYGESPGWFSQHTIIEIFNPDSQAWESHDGTQNLYFRDSERGEYATVARMVFGSLDTIEGCTPEECNTSTHVDHIKVRLGAFRYGASTEVWVNPDRLDMSRRVEAFDNHNFAEFMADLTGVNVQTMLFRFDAWQ